MSTFRVEIVEIKEVNKHPNADALDLCKVFGWQVVTQKGLYLPGDYAVYVPVDSILSQELEAKLFPPQSKIKLSKRRIKSIKLRGQISQGMLIPFEDTELNLGIDCNTGDDVAELLGITKYEPTVRELPKHMNVKTSKKVTNPNFGKYTDVENYKWHDQLFQDGEPVYISEKLHGTSFRAGWFKNESNSLWKKIQKFFGFLPEYEFCWGSRNVQIQGKLFHTGYYETDVYTKMVNQYDLKNRIPKGSAVYGEIVGDGIQKNYTYGCGPGEHKLYVYDIQKDGKWLDYYSDALTLGSNDNSFCLNAPPETFNVITSQLGLDPVPCLYVGPFSQQVVELLRTGDSKIGGQKVREGIVIKPIVEQLSSIGRKVLKVINDDYYLAKDENTEFH